MSALEDGSAASSAAIEATDPGSLTGDAAAPAAETDPSPAAAPDPARAG